MMPGTIDGLQVCRSIKSDVAMADVKVVLLSARGQARDREAGAQAGADVYLVKPFSPLELIDTIERLMASAATPASAPAAFVALAQQTAAKAPFDFPAPTL